MNFTSIILLFALCKTMLCDKFNFIPKDENGLGYFIAYTDENEQTDVKVEDILEEFKNKKEFKE
jgi:hypothetical protein